MPRHRLRDSTWTSLHAKLRAVSGIWKRDIERRRRCLEAVVHVLRTGVAWDDLPKRFGKPNSLYRRFRRWSQLGIRDALFTAVAPLIMIDRTALAQHSS
jgi:transposase